jgi:hypothetical protein
MRLLNVHTRQLKTFIGSERPPYAILSHTWEDEEVEFADISAPDVEQRRGYAKIDYICRQAAKLASKLDWVWIDTCCINKDSSSELSEAINSMFSWYSDAEICYAYLEDVDVDVDTSKLETDLRGAKWFTRGWTLQELLAPRRVEFYGKSWKKIGTKDTESPHITPFIDTLGSITQIDVLVLWKPAYMRAKSVAARMSWASKRKTTREEDLAYCLLGLFDVNMPLLYGEGERAFTRLQEEIIRISDDHSIFAWDRDLNNSAAVSCFAKLPSLFRRGSLVLPFGRKNSQRIPYSLTNQGLQISLPLFQKPDTNITYGLLNCHWDNTLSECIGIPLVPTANPEIFERSPHQGPESILLEEMTANATKGIFLSTRPREELPFAAEVSLQIYDESLMKQFGFSPVEVINPPNFTYHWHPDYRNMRLRWLADDDGKMDEQICLIWRHDSLDGNGLTLDMSCAISDQGFQVHEMKFSLTVPRETVSDSVQQADGHQSTLEAKITIPLTSIDSDSSASIDISAELVCRNVFGNEVYTLDMKTSQLKPLES